MPLAQLVEHSTFNRVVWGSNPQWHTYPTIEEGAGNFSPRRNNDRIKLNQETDYKKVQGAQTINPTTYKSIKTDSSGG